MLLTDSHAHLDSEELARDLKGVVDRARAAEVGRILNVSSKAGDFEQLAATAESLPETYAAAGVHPHEASSWCDDHAARLKRLAREGRLVAIGETGLDYHYDHSPRPTQLECFRAQVRLAREVGLPLVIHSREAEADTARLLTEEGAGEVGGVLHCFTSGPDLAQAALDLGFYVSFSGILTFPSAASIRETAQRVPDDRLLVETDSPYLAPVPKRGTWPNEPAFVRHTAEALAKLRGQTLEALAALTTANFEALFLRSAARAPAAGRPR